MNIGRNYNVGWSKDKYIGRNYNVGWSKDEYRTEL